MPLFTQNSHQLDSKKNTTKGSRNESIISGFGRIACFVKQIPQSFRFQALESEKVTWLFNKKCNHIIILFRVQSLNYYVLTRICKYAHLRRYNSSRGMYV